MPAPTGVPRAGDVTHRIKVGKPRLSKRDYFTRLTYDSPLKDLLSAETRTSVCDPLHILVWRDYAASLTVPGRAICLVAPDRHRYPRQ